MVSCKSCKKKDKREYADDCFACDRGDQWEAKRHRSPNKPKTNADRIRSMTDEELLNWINGIPSACMDFDNESRCTLFDTCRECWLEWLKQEASG